jgi:hypothetical protein
MQSNVGKLEAVPEANPKCCIVAYHILSEYYIYYMQDEAY